MICVEKSDEKDRDVFEDGRGSRIASRDRVASASHSDPGKPRTLHRRGTVFIFGQRQ